MKTYSIGDMARLTGLSHRMLRHYESLGLLDPERTTAGYRVYDDSHLSRLYVVSALKGMGLSLRKIARMAETGFADLAKVAADHRGRLETERRSLSAAITVLSRVVAGDVSPDDLSQLMRLEQDRRSPDAQAAYYERHYSDLEHDLWSDAKESLARVFGPTGYDQLWQDLFRRIEDALPLDPASLEARQFLTDWNALLGPMTALVGREQIEKSRQLLDRRESPDDTGPQETPEHIWRFISDAAALHTPSSKGQTHD